MKLLVWQIGICMANPTRKLLAYLVDRTQISMNEYYAAVGATTAPPVQSVFTVKSSFLNGVSAVLPPLAICRHKSEQQICLGSNFP